MRRISAIAVCLLGGVLGSVLLACSGAPPDDAADYELTKSSGRAPAPTPIPIPTASPSVSPPPEEADPPPVEKQLAVKNYRGTLGAATKVPFGGPPYCKYEVILRNIVVELGVLETGDLHSVTVNDNVIENAISCAYPPADPSSQAFTFKTITKTATGNHVEFTGAAANKTKASLVVDLVPKGTGYEASLKWKRTDRTGSLAWTVSAKVQTAPKATP